MGVNPNTVAKAYAVLEEQGFVCSLPKKGAFVIYESEQEKAEDKRKRLVYDLYNAGVDKETLMVWIKEVYGND
jgi:GntR family transcriptional regulator